MMKKIFAIFVLVWLAIVFIAPSFIGPRVAAGFNTYLQSDDIIHLRKYGISLTLKSYQQGYFASTAETELTIVNPSNNRLLLSSTLHYQFTHAPLSLSGINVLTVEMDNAAEVTGELADALPAEFLHAQSRVNVLGHITQTVNLYPTSIQSTSLPFSRVTTKGVTIHWNSHLRDFPHYGHGRLDSPAITLQTQQAETYVIDNLRATLAITNQHKTLTLNELSVDYQTPDDQRIHTSIARLEQTQSLDEHSAPILPLAHALAIRDLTLTYNEQPQLTIHTLAGNVGLNQTGSDYELGLDWTSELTIDPAHDATRFPWLAILPTKQTISLNLSPIDSRQLSAWSSVVTAMAQPTAQSSQYLTQLGQLLRYNIAHKRMQFQLAANLQRDQSTLAAIDVFIDEQLEDAQQLNALINHGLNPHWFYDSHADISLNRTWLKDLTVLPWFVLLMGEWLAPDAQGNLNLRADITNQQLVINEQMID